MLFGETKCIEHSINTEKNQRPCMKISIHNDDLNTDIHIQNKFEQEPPENNGNGQLYTKGNLINDLNIEFQTTNKIIFTCLPLGRPSPIDPIHLSCSLAL